jgi:capsular polysaccharide biosynthesis protein
MSNLLSRYLLQGISVHTQRMNAPAVASLEVNRTPIGANAPSFAQEAAYLCTQPEKSVRKAFLLRQAMYDPLTNVLLKRRGRIFRESENVWREYPNHAFADRYYWRYHYTRPLRKLDGICMVLRSPANNYYHTLVDNLPRLYWLHQLPNPRQPVRLLVPGPMRTWEAYYVPRMLPENVEITQVDPAFLWRAENMLFGDYLSDQMSGALPKAYLDFFLPRVLPDRPRRRTRKIYISRRQAPGGRRMHNEDDVRELVQRMGYEIHLLENLEIPQQIALFYDARTIVAPHGAGLTNILFSQSIDLVELHPTPTIMPHYYLMARAMGHQYHYLCSNETNRHSSFTLDIRKLRDMLEQIDDKLAPG